MRNSALKKTAFLSAHPVTKYSGWDVTFCSIYTIDVLQQHRESNVVVWGGGANIFSRVENTFFSQNVDSTLGENVAHFIFMTH